MNIRSDTRFTPSSTWASMNVYPRQIRDINEDGRADIIGFGHRYVHPSYSHGRIPMSTMYSLFGN